MTTGKGLFLGLALIAGAIVIVGMSDRTRADSEPPRYMIAAGGEYGWSIDTLTGRIKVCSPGGLCTFAIDR